MSTSKNDVFNFKEFPDFQSERLRLSSISEKDATDILSLRTNPKVAKYIDRKQTKDVDAAKEFINYVNNGFTEKKFIFWGIRLMSESPLIGTMSLWHFTDDRKEAEVGYELHPAYWGKGYANEALLKVIEFSFHILKLRKIEAFTHHENTASRYLLEKNNFKLNPNRVDDGNLNNVIYELRELHSSGL